MDVRREDVPEENPHQYESIQMEKPSTTREEIRTTHTPIVTIIVACGVFLIIGTGLGLIIGYFAFSLKGNQSNSSDPDMTPVPTTAPSKECEAEHFQKRTCADIVTSCGSPKSGVYDMYSPTRAYCDMDSGKGGWTVFQRRINGTVNFERNWEDYRTGFGQLDGEFWLGNENLHMLTSMSSSNLLQIDLEDWEGHRASIIYKGFYVENEANNYTLRLKGPCRIPGGIGLTRQNHQPFTTYDRDNHGCVALYHGGWWYEKCHNSNLNGLYYNGGWHNGSYATGMNWFTWRGHYYSIKKTEMKFRQGICSNI